MCHSGAYTIVGIHRKNELKNFKTYLLTALISITIIFATGWVAFGSHTSISVLHEICFYFHLIPFRIAFTGGSETSMILYYLGLWFIITLVLIPIVKVIKSSKNRRKILISLISIITIGIIAIVLIDWNIKTEREDRIAQNEEEDKKNFNTLRTGDIIFQTPIKSDSMDYKIAMINVDVHGYTVLEITDRVQHSSLRIWTQNIKNYTIKRLINADSILNEHSIKKFRTERQKFIFKNYDSAYCWTNAKIYDSELIWKTYKRAFSIEICKLDTISDLNKNISDPEVCSEKYFVTPKKIFESEKLITVKEK